MKNKLLRITLRSNANDYHLKGFVTLKLSHLFVCISTATCSMGVYSQNTHSDSPANIEKIEVFGHKLTLDNQDVAASVSSLNAKEIERQQVADLTQLLRTLPGVDVSGSVNPLSGQPSIRGLYGERIHVSVDNVKRKSESDGSQNIAVINSLGVDPNQLKQVQVLRGADSLTVGSGALGGSIRLVTKNAADYLAAENGVGVNVAANYQSVSDAVFYSASAFHLTDTLDTVAYISQVNYSDIDIVKKDHAQEDEAIAQLDKIKNESQRTNLTLKNTWYFMPEHSLQSKLDFSETESLDQPYGQRLDLGITYPTLSEDYKNDYIEGMLNYTYQPQNMFIDLDVQAFYSKKTYDETTNGYIMRGENKIDFDKVSNGENKRYGLRVANLATFTGLIDHKLAIEFSFDRELFDQQQYEKKTLSSYYGQSQGDNVSLSVIDQSEFFNKRILLTAGLRYDNYDRSSDTFISFADNKNNALSKELGVTFKATENINFYMKAAEAFRAPSLQELYKKDEWRCHIGGKLCYSEPQPNLKAESALNYEGGIGFAWQDTAYIDQLSIKAIYFKSNIDDYIDNVPYMYYIDADGNKQLGSPGPDPANGIPVATHRDYSAKNIGQLKSEGFEIEAKYQYKNLDMYLGYAKLNMDIIGLPNFFLGTIDYNKQPYAEAPANKLTWNTNYQLNDNFNVGIQLLHYRAQQRLSDTYKKYGYGTSTYSIYNLNAQYQGSDSLSNLSVRFGVNNLTNKRYLRAPASEANDPSELGRNYKVTLSYQF